jgi:hypothetical protein
MAMVQPLEAGIHSQCASGVFSRYAPHFLIWGILFGIGILLAGLGLSRPKTGTLLYHPAKQRFSSLFELPGLTRSHL